MQLKRQRCWKPLISLCVLVCLGCGSSQSGPAPTAQSDATTPSVETLNDLASDLSAPVAKEASSTPESQAKSDAAPDKSTKTASEPATKANEPPAAKPAPEQPTTKQPATKPKAQPKPTAEQLERWKFVSFDPLQLLAYRENEKTGFVFFIAGLNDGKHYLLGGTKLTLWALEGTEPEHVFLEAQTSDDKRLLSFAVSPAGDWCAAGDVGGLLRTFHLQDRKEIASKPTGTRGVVSIAVSPDGKEVATIGHVSEVTIWDAKTLEKKRSIKVDTREVKHLQYIAPQTLVAAGESMSSWNTSTGDKIATFPSERYQSAVALSPDGKELVFGSDSFLQRWNLADNAASGEYRSVPARNSAIRFSSDGKLVAVATGEAVRILDAATGQMLQVIDACGSTISDASWVPEKHLLLVATDTGRTRVWGSPEDGKAFGLTPLHEPLTGASNNPATVPENLATLDLRLLPKLPGAKPQSDSFNSSHYVAPVGIDETKAFYRYMLGERGWTEVSDQATEYTIPFRKNGYTLTLSPYGERPTETTASLTFSGNYDLRKTPKLDAFLKGVLYEGDASVIYKVSANLLQIETELLKQLHAAGWTAIARLNRSQGEEADTRDLEFVKNGTVLRVSVQRDRDDNSLFVISYGQSLSLHALPVPADVGIMEWDDYAEPQMVANTKLSMEEATAFYEEAMPKQGWIAREKGRRIDQDAVYLPYYWGQRDVTIALEPLGDGMVRIRSGKYSQSSWQKPESQAESKSETTDDQTLEGIEAADLPILHAVGAPTYKERDGIRFELEKIPLIDLSKEYSKAMEEIGWTVKAFGEPQEKTVSLHFEKGSKIVYYQSSIDPRGIGYLSLSGNGLLWTKPIASKQRISYSAWLQNNKFPATLTRLGQYIAEMEKLPDDSKAP
jgi:WD40 repeat protein